MNIRRALSALLDWRWSLFFLQRRVRKPGSRDAAVRMIARLRPAAAGPAPAAAARALCEEGQVELGIVLDAKQCEEVRRYLMERKVHDAYRPETAPWLPLAGVRHPHSHVGYHDHEDVVRAPYLLALANRPDILALVEGALGCRPTISYIAAWWSYATGIAAQQAENFHRDVDDWRFIKLFVYLTEVDATKGPHIYVRGSAGADLATTLRRYTDEEIALTFPADDVVTMTGGPGTAFLENTYGFHKGQPVAEGHRLIFQVVYSMFPLPYGPRRPVIGRAEAAARAGEQVDAFVNRVYVTRKG